MADNLLPVDEARLLDHPVDHHSLTIDPSSLYGLGVTDTDPQTTGHLTTLIPEPHTLDELASNRVLTHNNSETTLQYNDALPERQVASWPTACVQSAPWLQNHEWYTGYTSDNSPSHWSNENFFIPQASLPLPGEINDGHLENRNSWLQQSRLQSNYPLNSNGIRGLPRRRSRYSLQRTESRATPQFVPNPLYAPDPMQRWQESPPEDEPASMSAIMNTLKNLPSAGIQPGGFTFESSAPFRENDPFSGFRRPVSTVSSHSSAPSVSSHPSTASVKSSASKRSHDSLKISNRRSTGRVLKSKSAKSTRKFCCTFCCDQFRTKYDWARHERTLHLNLESWTCTPHGAFVTSPITGQQHCAYCNMVEPGTEHLDEHNYQACLSGSRTFRRKDHLVQHLRLTHNLDAIPVIDDWKTPAPVVTSRCGFCDRRLSSWEERVDHIASHFRNGSTMDDWTGEHDFPPEIIQHVTDSLPPYYIGYDSRCLVPFSVTNAHAKDQLDQITSRLHWDTATEGNTSNALAQAFPSVQPSNDSLSSLLEVLASHLGRFTRQKLAQGIIPTDEMLQQESRKLVYDSEDPWDQTIFDNPEWLAAFRREHIERRNNPDHEEQALSQFDSLSVTQPPHTDYV
ncbi:hypothetical protein BDV26DRAFT_295803 [Aspergillus bertholletiae]|uniref:C2H2-type domain-containing protein n=1 Tax=Aspergillus bertholletiae TaxID=1226010 RepID=A0A5N7AXK4_9EURO|nr:hypothetical protein BDV26DRAFT_295803 [Aspergillus bertholletiae]